MMTKLYYQKWKGFLFLMSTMVLLSLAGRAVSQENPVQMLKSVTSQVMNELKNNRSTLRRDPDQVFGMVERFILPHVDFIEMARWVVGRNAWKEASAETQRTFVHEFKTMVVRSYARSLLNYTDQEIEFLPLRDSAQKSRIKVSSIIKDHGREPIRMDYLLVQAGDTWRVYDIVIEGVSLVQGYRSQFAEDITSGGLDAALEKIQRHNRRNR